MKKIPKKTAAVAETVCILMNFNQPIVY